jgi:hypothetical protein
MNNRPSLDSLAFEKLISAAWILQCQHERQAHTQIVIDRDVPATASSDRAREAPNAADTCVALHEPWELAAASLTDETWRATYAVDSLQSDSAINVIPQCSVDIEPIDGTSSHVRPPRLAPLTSGAVRSSRNWLRSLSKSADWTRDRLRSVAHYKVKVRINVSWRHAVEFAVASFSVVLIVMAFTVFQEWHSERMDVAAATTSLGAKPEKRITLAPKAQISPFPISHRLVTDEAVLSAVLRLSPYEIRALRRQATYGDDFAALLMGMLYETGRYVPQSCTTAAAWVQKSADWGNAAAQYNLALRYREGDGVAVNESEAQRWLRRAVDQKYANARTVLESLTASNTSSPSP